MEVVYNNRYGDEIKFNEKENGEVNMLGGAWMRFMLDNNNEDIVMVDPSGGPYITIGTNLNIFFNDGKDRFVDKIYLVGEQVIFKVK